MIQANIEAPCTVLDFPRLEVSSGAAKQRVRHHRDPVILIGKVREMCTLIRRYPFGATGDSRGHIAALGPPSPHRRRFFM